ncbi:MAG: response regulator transcription factor [Bacteroidales bacterium]|nr:response regulator transcription factor [Bacteroidales bacterium]MDD6186250.1 response regulator transcription factor [Bacteroidales bacterium]
MTKIAIAEPSILLRTGLEQLLHELPDAEIIFSTDNLSSLYARINALHPDILIVNPLLYDYAKRATIRAEFDNLPNLRLIGLVTSYVESQHQRQFAGVIELNDDFQRIKSTLNQVTNSLQSDGDEPDTDPLSDREKEVLVCLSKGLKNNEIADTLNISVHTVITHRKNIVRKTGIKSVAALTVYAILNNLIEEKDII